MRSLRHVLPLRAVGAACALLAACLQGCASPPVTTRGGVAPPRNATLEEQLRSEFDALPPTPELLRAALADDAAGLADGPLFLAVLPALAYVNLAVDGRVAREEARRRVRPLLDLMLRETAARVGSPDLARLDGLRDHATWLGQLALLLGAWRLVGGDARDEAVHARVADVLADALRGTGGAPLRSYPHLRWSFDTVPVLLALRLRDRAAGRDDHGALVDAALAWADAHVDAATGLPGSRMALAGDGFTDAPRGSDLALRVALLAELDGARARAMYAHFVEHFGRSVLGVAAFAEWPDGLERAADRDSGPIVAGVGVAATGFGLAAATAAGDDVRAASLRRALARLPALYAASGAREGPRDPRRVTGSLAGDAAMFWALTWADWGVGSATGTRARRAP